MEQNKVTLYIKIKYGDLSKNIQTDELISYDELKDKIIELFSLDEKIKDNIELTYLDEDGDINILGQEKDELIFASKEIMDGIFSINLNLYIIKTEKENNIIVEENNQNNLIINEQDNKNEKNKEINLIMDDNELLKKKLKNDLNLIYKNKLEDLKDKINDLFNEKYNLIQKEIIQLSSDINKKDYIKINTNDIDDNTKISKMNIENEDIVIVENSDETIIYKRKKIKNIKVYNKNLNDIKEKIKSLINVKKKTNSVYMKYGDEIYDIMNNKGEDKIEIIDLNNYLKSYLSQKGKENLRADFINIISKIYKYIEIKNINKINLDFFEKGKYIEKEDNLLINEENIDYKSQLDNMADTKKYKEEVIQNFLNYATVQ